MTARTVGRGIAVLIVAVGFIIATSVAGAQSAKIEVLNVSTTGSTCCAGNSNGDCSDANASMGSGACESCGGGTDDCWGIKQSNSGAASSTTLADSPGTGTRAVGWTSDGGVEVDDGDGTGGGDDEYGLGQYRYTYQVKVTALSTQSWRVDLSHDGLGLAGLKGDGGATGVGNQDDSWAERSPVTVTANGNACSIGGTHHYETDCSNTCSSSQPSSISGSCNSVATGTGSATFNVSVSYDLKALSNDGCSGVICSSASGGEEAAYLFGLDAPESGANPNAGHYSSWGRSTSLDGYSANWTLDVFANCGNSTLESGEQCDEGAANGTSTGCCTSTCQYRATGQTCRALGGTGECDVAETCTGSNGVCPGDTLLSTSTVCRAATGECDQTESCSGASPSCPTDARKASGTSCTADSNLCTLDQCDGSSVTCQHAAGNAGTVCRGSAGVCDVAETCTGSSSACPADAKQSSGTACTGDGNACTLDQCDGSNVTCQHPAGNSGSVCRPATGVCDVAEACTGSSATCPADGLASSGTVCRSAAGECDLAESCTGSSASCPADDKKTNGTACTDDGNACTLDQCDGSNASCQHPAGHAGTACRGAAGECDLAESCTGSSTSCPTDAFKPASSECRTPAGACDLVESCTGSGADCPADAFEPPSTVCRAPAGDCDVAESCTGSAASCPADTLEPASTTCRPAASDCDLAETCTGSSVACPADDGATDGTTCNDGAACTIDDACVGGVCLGDSMTCGDGTFQGGCNEECDDGNLTDGDGCSAICEIEFACGPTPAIGCKLGIASRSGSLTLRNKTPDDGDKSGFKWSHGATTALSELGNPRTTTDYLLCLYDGTTLIASAKAPAGGTCVGKPCWTAKPTGFTYSDRARTPDGIDRVVLKAGFAGKAKVEVKSRGVDIPMPSLPLTGPVRAQLKNSDGACWEATFSAPATKNDATQFKDKSD